MLSFAACAAHAPMRSGARIGRRVVLALAVALAGGAVSASGAWAAEVTSVGGTITYESTVGDVDCLQISYLNAPDRYRFEGTCGPPPFIIAVDCSQISLTAVECDDDSVTAVTVNLADGNDSASAAGQTLPDPLTLNGGAGGDTLTLDDSGLGTANGGDDGDSLTGGSGADALNGGDVGDSISGLAGADTINGDAGSDTVYGGENNDIVNGGADNDNLHGEAGEDSLHGDASDDYLTGGEGNDTINGDDGNDGVYGEAGEDSVHGDAGGDTVSGGADNDIVNGGEDNDNLYGEAGEDSLHGDAGDDNVSGGEGNETFTPEAGNDFFAGDGGVDTMDYSANSAAQPINVTQNGGGDDDDGQGTVDNVWVDIETINGGAGPDIIDSTSASQPVSLSGNGGNDALTGSYHLTGSLFDDTIDGGAANDRLRGRFGADSLVGAAGIDRVLYDDHSGVTVSLDGVQNDGNAGEDGAGDNVDTTVESVQGSGSSDTLTGSCANNTLAPMDGNDTVNGDPAAGCLVPGNDFMGGYSGTGGYNGEDTFNGQGGTDAVTYTLNSAGQSIFVTLDGTANDHDGTGAMTENVARDIETVYGGLGNDVINAGSATQGVSLYGRVGNDTLFGSNFNDFLDGEAGADTLNCRAGSDLYRHDGTGPAPTNCETLLP